MPFGLGFGETVLIFLVLVLLFGPGKLPEIGGAMGRGIRDFRNALSGLGEDAGPGTAPLPARAAPDHALPTSGPTPDQVAPDGAPRDDPPDARPAG